MEAAAGRPDSDETLVSRFQRGDASAFDELVTRHRRAVYRLAYRLLGSHEDADDVSQEAFLRAYRGLGRFRGESSFRTWVVRIVLNLARSARRSRRVFLPFEHAGELLQPGDPQEASLRQQVRRAVERLPFRQRQVLVLKVYEGMKFVEIAQAARMSVGTAKATFFQAVRNLRKRLGAPTARPQAQEDAGA